MDLNPRSPWCLFGCDDDGLLKSCPWHGQLPCKGGCGEIVDHGGLAHYVSSVGHLSSLEDAIEPYYRCQKMTA